MTKKLNIFVTHELNRKIEEEAYPELTKSSFVSSAIELCLENIDLFMDYIKTEKNQKKNKKLYQYKK